MVRAVALKEDSCTFQKITVTATGKWDVVWKWKYKDAKSTK